MMPDDALDTEDLRAGFLKYTRDAFRLLPPMVQPRVMDIGCGTGLPTLELARLSDGAIVGIDTDAEAIDRLRQRIDASGLAERISTRHVSLFDNGFENGSFDVVWEEGVLHLLDPATSLAECRRLLKPRGFLVMNETVEWFSSVRDRVPAAGFSIVDQLLLPERAWWTDYYAPLAERTRHLRSAQIGSIGAEQLAQLEREIAMVKAAPERFACGFFITQASDAQQASAQDPQTPCPLPK
jgi:SAM-dependent methyltransferase